MIQAQSVRELEREPDRLVDELDRLEQPVGETKFEPLRAVEHPVLLQRVRHDELDRVLDADQARHELRAAPGGKDAEEDLGAREVADGAGNRARGAVESDLDAAAEARAVDRRDGRVGQRREASEQLVPCARAEARLLARADLRKLLQVGARGEDERLAGQHHRDPAAGLELGQELREGLHRRAREKRRLRVVLAVVDRDERERPEPRVDAVELELRDGIAHWRFSQSTAAPIPMPMQSAVRP